jgi:predicted enzyme related to lactoylglutathione lyase
MRFICVISLALSVMSIAFATDAGVTTKSTAQKEAKLKAFELGFFAIPVSNMETAKSFYKNVMGWDFKDRDPQFSYVFANDNMIGAIELARDNFKPSVDGPLLYFRADLMTKTLGKVTSSGGKVQEKIAIENGDRGYTARIQDPFKNTIGFWAEKD